MKLTQSILRVKKNIQMQAVLLLVRLVLPMLLVVLLEQSVLLSRPGLREVRTRKNWPRLLTAARWRWGLRNSCLQARILSFSKDSG